MNVKDGRLLAKSINRISRMMKVVRFQMELGQWVATVEVLAPAMLVRHS